MGEVKPGDISKIEMIDDANAAMLGQKSGAERLAIMFGLYRFARKLLEARVRAEMPHASLGEQTREVTRRLSHGSI